MSNAQIGERAPRQSHAQRVSDRRRIICLAIAIAPLVVLAVEAWNRRWMSDDGFINLRVVDQLLHGHGPVFNAGERVEASTSPLWVFQLALTKRVFFFVKLEWIAVWWGLIGSIAGLAMAERGSWLLAQRSGASRDRSPLFLPAGALVVAAVAPFWDYATSGLESGMTFAWLGGSFWALASRLPSEPGAAQPRSPRALWVAAIVIGLGPLIRPDLALFTAAFLVALVLVDPNRSWRHRADVVLAAMAIPLAYEVFRMAFFGALVPNTALAKEPGMAAWSRGADYLRDFVKPYWLWLPAAVVLGIVAARTTDGIRSRRVGPVAITLAPVVSALVYVLYVVRIGGDFMHARMLLPALFAFLLPVAVVHVRTPWALAAIAVIAVWAIVSVVWLRVPYSNSGPHLLADERASWVQRTGHRNPVPIADFTSVWAHFGTDAKQRAQQGERVFQVVPSEGLTQWLGDTSKPYDSALTLPLAAGVKAKGVVAFPAIGQIGYAAGRDVYVVDLLGLGDPIASRTTVKQFLLPGHNKLTDPSWAIARFVDPSTPIADTVLSDRVASARRAIRCGQLAQVLRDTTGHVSVAKLTETFFDSWTLTNLRFDRSPAVAAAQLCR